MSTLADRLTLALKAHGGTQAELARACQVKPPSVADWFSGETKSLKGLSLLRAAAFLHVDALWLATGEGEMRPSAPGVRAPAPAPVMEGPSADWPFRFITPKRWRDLPSTERARVETFADATLQAWEARNPDKSNGTAG